MREHGDVGGSVDADALEGDIGPLGDHLFGVWESLLGGKGRPRVADVGPPAGGAGQHAKRGGVVDGAEDDHSRGRGGDIDEHRNAAVELAQLGALCPQKLRGGLEGGFVERRVAEGSLACLIRTQ